MTVGCIKRKRNDNNENVYQALGKVGENIFENWKNFCLA